MTLLSMLPDGQRRVLNPSGGCHNCPRKRVGFVPATLRRGSVLWLGEAPGANEVEEGEGFVGRAGQLLRKEAQAAGVPEPWSFSNVVHCRPPKNATPKAKEVQCCLSQFVLDEVRGYPIVVLCGNVALQALFPGAQGSHFRGNVAWHPDFPGQRFFAIYHPAYILRRPDLTSVFQRHLARLARIAREPGAEDAWKVVHGPAAFKTLEDVLKAPLVSLDLETTSVVSWEVGARIRSVAATADGVTVAALHEEDPPFVAALERIRDFLENPEKAVVAANTGFDAEWVERELGCFVRCQVHDVNIVWYEAGQYQQPSLKELAAQEADGYRYLVHEPHLERDTGLLLRYNAEDVVQQLTLFKAGMRRLKPKGRDLVTRVLGPVALVFREMQAHGLYVRQDYRREQIEAHQNARREAVQRWKDEDPAFIPKTHESGHGLRKYLFEIRKLPVIHLTPKGGPATDKAAIRQWIRDGATYLRHLLKIREIDKLLTTYLMAYDDHVGHDSRVHPSYWLTSTDTGRPSSSNPNVMNIPRAKVIRDLFGVRPGSRLIETDLAQIEFRVMVCLAGDETGIEGFLRGDDAHTMTARSFNPNPTKEDRTNAKPVNFSLLYGGYAGGVLRMARDDYGLDWTPAQAEEFTEAFFALYRRLPEFHAGSRRRLLDNRGWFESVVGHTYHYRNWDHPDQETREHTFRSALNAEAQGPAAAIMFYIKVLARRLLYERGFRGVAFVNSVYDSVLTEVPDPAWVPAVIEALNDARDQAYEWVRPWFIVPLEQEHAVGESWGSLKEWEED